MFNELTAQQTLRNKGRRLGLSVVTLLAMWGSPLVSKAVAMPAHFKAYAMTDIGGGLRCIVGNTIDEGLNGRAYVYVVDLATHKIRWVTRIPLTPDSYQNRATHCLADDRKVYALVQTDTSSSQALSQTFVDVAVLDRATGHINSTEKVIAKEAGSTPSTWVGGAAESFRFENGKIVVTGQYFNLDDPDTRKPFTASPTP